MKTFLVLTLIFLCTHLCISQECKTAKPLLSDHYVKFAPNNNSIWFGNNGDFAFNPTTGRSGWEWPSGSGKHVCFEAGLMYGGLVNGKVKAGGSMYRHGLQGGKILSNGKPANRNDSTYRIYHITRDDEKTKSNPDYLNWPSQDGAPVDEDGKPFLFGDEQIWFVSNDLDTLRTQRLFGCDPIGFEIQTTVWAFNKNTHFNDVVFVRHLLINKGNDDLKEAYLGIWNDFDLGDANSDFVGVDTTLKLSYVYNAYFRDFVYGVPPSAGFQFMQTPKIPSSSDSVLFNGKTRKDFKYCPLSSFVFYVGCGNIYREPETNSYRGAIELYNQLRGFIWNGNPITDPITGFPTKFCLSGDPLKKQGWIDGILSSPGDRRSMISVGPFEIAKGDTQEVVYAMVVAQDVDHVRSIKKLWNLAGTLKYCYPDNYPIVEIPIKKKYDLALEQNFPNPFNVTTTIKYSLPVPTKVKLKIHNALGQEIAALVNREDKEGQYSIKWDAKDVSSGIYFYELEAVGLFLRKKMVLLR